jgi:uncharacterized protein
MSTNRPIIDFHTHLWWWPEHLTDEFADEALAAKKAKLAISSNVFVSAADRHSFDSTPEMHRRDTAAADRVVVLGFSAEHLHVVVPNELIADYVSRDRDRLVGFAGIEPMKPLRSRGDEAPLPRTRAARPEDQSGVPELRSDRLVAH